MPITEIFRVEQNDAALDFNLSASRNSIIRVGTYTLVSNNTISKFRLSIRPGEDGNQERFAFMLDEGNPCPKGKSQRYPLPYVYRAIFLAQSMLLDSKQWKRIWVYEELMAIMIQSSMRQGIFLLRFLISTQTFMQQGGTQQQFS